MKFVDRIDEAARLKDALVREKSSLVVMYGRRRLGKSTLIKRVLSENDVYFLADRSEGQHQRVLLAKVIAQVFPDFDKLTYPDWESMFRAVNYRTDKRFTLCLCFYPNRTNFNLCIGEHALYPFFEARFLVFKLKSCKVFPCLSSLASHRISSSSCKAYSTRK